MAIKFENTPGSPSKPAEKKAEAARASAGDEDRKKAEAAGEEPEASSAKAKKPRAGFRKK